MEQEKTTDSDILIAVIGDTHLRDTQYATARRGLDFYEAFKEAIKVACYEADLIVLTGDLFDKSRPSARVISQLMHIDLMLKSAGKTALAITGNHDWSNPTWLETLFPGREDASSPGIVPLDGKSMTYAGFTLAGLRPYTAGAFRANLAEITVQVRHADVVLYHGLVDGVIRLPFAAQDPLHVSEFPVSKKNKAWLLGDIHVQSHTSIDRPGGGTCLVCYPGSTEMCNAAETLEKSVLLVRLNRDEAKVVSSLPFPTRPFIAAEVSTEEQLEELMRKVEPVADKDPVAIVKFSRSLPQTVNRLHSMLDAQRAVVRCYPLPSQNLHTTRAESDDNEEDLGMDHFVTKRFEDRPDLQETALALLARGESDASNIISDMIEARLAATGVREDEE